MQRRSKLGCQCEFDFAFPLIAGEAVFARCLSSLKDERVAASKEIPGPSATFTGDKKAFVEDIRKVVWMCGFDGLALSVLSSPLADRNKGGNGQQIQDTKKKGEGGDGGSLVNIQMY